MIRNLYKMVEKLILKILDSVNGVAGKYITIKNNNILNFPSKYF